MNFNPSDYSNISTNIVNEGMTCICYPTNSGGGFTKIKLLKKLKDYKAANINYDIVRDYFETAISNMLKINSNLKATADLYAIQFALASEDITYDSAAINIESFKNTNWDIISPLVDQLPDIS